MGIKGKRAKGSFKFIENLSVCALGKRAVLVVLVVLASCSFVFSTDSYKVELQTYRGEKQSIPMADVLESNPQGPIDESKLEEISYELSQSSTLELNNVEDYGLENLERLVDLLKEDLENHLQDFVGTPNTVELESHEEEGIGLENEENEIDLVEASEPTEERSFKFSAVTLHVAPSAIDLIDFYNEPFLGEEMIKSSDYGFEVGAMFERRVNKGFSFGADVSYALALFKDALLPGGKAFSYLKASANVKALLAIGNSDLYAGFDAGAMLHMNAGVKTLSAYVGLRLGVDLFVSQKVALGIESGASVAHLPLEDEIKSSFTILVDPISVGITLVL